MRLVQFYLKGEGGTSSGLVEGDEIHELKHGIFGPYETTGRVYSFDDVVLRPPVNPGKIPALGLNYSCHANEMKIDPPKEPMLFMKVPSSVIGPSRAIVCPPVSKRVDYEAELGAVIGRRAKNVSKDRAFDYVLGYTCLNDVTARDLQDMAGRWTRAKGFDTFCPLGPAIETDLDPSALTIESLLNGEIKQSSTTANLIFNVPELIEYISAVMTLEPGDVIATGTPSGIGPLTPGDSIEIRIQGIGSLVNPVKAG